MSGRARDAGLDATRVTAMLGVLIVHAMAAYSQTPIGWAIAEPAGTLAIDGAMWIGRAFLMPVFFLLAGNLSGQSLRRAGPNRFARSRLARLAIPLAVLVVPVSLAMSELWDWGRTLTGRASVSSAVPALEASSLPITLAHLWYLYYLILFSAAALLVSRLRGRGKATRFDPLIAVAAVFLALVFAGGLQLDTPLGFVPDPFFALSYGAFFAWGWRLDRNRLARAAPLALAAAVISFAGLLPDLLASSDGEAPRLHAQLASAAFSVSMVALFVGAWLAVRVRPRRWLRWLADATYWTYIVHLPVVVVAQLALHQSAAPALVKILVAIGFGLAVALVSYALVIRRTRLARLVG